jgi:uncharacterized protein (DUF885 family)
MMKILSIVASAALLTTAAAARADETPDVAFETLAQEILADYYRRNPTEATELGLHEFDGELENYSRAAIEDELAALKRFAAALERVTPDALSVTQRLDREVLLHSLESRRLVAAEIRPWARDPDLYSSGLTSAGFSLIKRDYAPAIVRLRRLVERERAMPVALAEARRNLEDPPRIFTQIALEQIDGNIEFFRTAVVEAFAAVTDPALMADFHRANDAVIAALDDYKTWLAKDLLPRSKGRFAYGAELYRSKLQADEMIDTPLPELLRMAEKDLKRNQAAFVETARRIDPSKPPIEVLESLQTDHPAPNQLLAATQSELDALRQFITDRHIVTIPKDAEPALVRETPPFLRATTAASMDTPGPFERAGLRGYYYMTLPDPSWTSAETEEFMRQWYYPLISNVSVHEVWPGHYLQFLYAKAYPSDVRRVFGTASNFEGWAHYCESMMLDEGFHDGDPAYRLAQLQDALLRDARFIVGIRLHTDGMTIEQAEEFFEKQGYQPRPVAVSETKRGTSDATYGYYTMGKLAILKLREDYRRKLGDAYSLQQFHDRFVALGPLPLPLVREALLGERGSLF